MGFDFPRIDAQTFTYLLDKKSDNHALFFYKYMEDNHESLKEPFESLFTDGTELSNFIENLSQQEFDKWRAEYGRDMTTSTAMCEFLMTFFRKTELGAFYLKYKSLGGCQQSEEQVQAYMEFVKDKVKDRVQKEDNLDEFVPEDDELINRKLFRCHKILNVLHSILKSKANAYRAMKYAQKQR